jgi:penicillin-insensitive murein DD-endopeptidase
MHLMVRFTGLLLTAGVAAGGAVIAQTEAPAVSPRDPISGVAAFAAPGIAAAQAVQPLPSEQSDPDAVPAAAQSAPEAPGGAPPMSPVPSAAVKAKPKKPLIAAKILFGAVRSPAPLEARAIGFYSKGCLAGAKAVPIDGPAWQVMRLSRNRNWGHPALTAWVERFARDAQSLEGWSGLLVGDMSQPRGGPMLTGHASHQIGLDADLWLTPMPNRRLTPREREDLAATSMLPAGNEKSVTVDPAVWTETHVKLIRRAANYAEVERILVHPAIKKALCDAAPTLGPDRAWLWKVRPFWGHHYHMHVRMSCPPDSPGCRPQNATLSDDGCGKELADWLTLVSRPDPPPAPPPPVPVTPPPPKPKLTLDMLPPECRAVLGPLARGG